MATALLDSSICLEQAVREVERLGVKARALWVVRLEPDGSTRVCPGVGIGEDHYWTADSAMHDLEQAVEWAAVVATLARGVRA